MGPLELLNHLLNFLAPALWLAVLVTLAARFFMKKRPVALSLYAQTAINFVVSGAALALGLWFFGHDGKMATYAGMMLLCATSQWLMLRGWKA
ncbi:hypothetical protein [Rhodoferax sp. UBA5149]|uniref:hypothetical protein n=1 Tax=Rhodoferax sp. UBA5149 TaxID=1947379 RepID=UPI0025F6259A|nr:hypothetical protein [Rhodoferax sp. UBA5149]